MTISLAQTASLTCPVCGVAFDAEVWLIVAADERPDLVARIRAGTLHTVVCPNGHASQIDAPLLLYRPDADPPILFSPAEQTTREQDQQQAAGLIGALREQLGNAWRDAWLVQGLPGVQRAMLPIALADDPEAALHAAQAQMQQALDELRERDPDAFAQLEAEAQQMMETTDAPDATPGDTGDIADIPAVPPLVETLNAFISARSWMDSYRQVQAHPELLSDEALAFLDQAITAAQAQGNSNAVAIYTEHRDLLRRCREIGTDAAFAEKMNVPVAQLQDQQAPGNLPPDVQAVLAELAREGPITSPEELERRLAARPDLRERLERAAGETAGAMHIPPEVQPVIAKIAQLNRVSEMLQRVALCRQALTLIVPATHPQLWAALQGELGNSLAQNPLGERAENLEQAIAAYEQALTVMTRAAMPVEWAQTTMNLANAYRNRIRGERAENLEQAIAAYEQALTVMTRAAMPVEWAQTTMNLANAYYSRIRGERAENLEQAIAAYEQALTVRTRAAMPVEWAQTTMNLATAYYSRIRGERAENLEQAIAAYEQALTVMTRAAMPVEWAQTTMNLANAYRNRIRGERAENLEQAIAAYEQALTVMTRAAMPVEWATTTMNLATAYADRIRGERAENLEQAIAAYEQALTVMTRAAMPVEWATTTMNLANAYADRIRGERAENLEQAIAAYEQALTVMTRAAMPVEWATTTMNLATAYRNRIRGERAENLEQAIAAYEQALTVMTRAAMPVEWATTTMNLATAYYYRIRGERAENLEQAIAAYEQALTVRTRAAMPVEWATTTMNLATAYYSRIRGERAENLEQAIAAYEQALTVFQPEMLPDDCRRTARNLGHVRAETGNWKAAAVAYDLALQAAEVLYKEAASHFGKEAELSANSDLFRRAAYALAHTAEPSAYRRAGEVAESGRARGLGETLARDRSDLSEIERDYPETYERYRAAAEQVRLFEQAARADERRTGELPPGIRSEDLVRRIVAAREQLDAAIEAIRALPGYDGFLRPLTYAEIVATARPGVPLVYLITTPQGSLALIVPFGADEPEALQLDDFTETDLDGLLIKRESNEVVGGYLPGQLTGGAALTTALAEGLPLLGAALAAPLAARLRELHATGVTLVPTGLLSLLPLHAATYTVDGQTRCLLDEFDVAYAPSARVLATAQREQQRRAGGALRLAGVGNPLPSLETGAWAQRELAHALPGINKHGAVVLPRLEAAARQAAPKTREQLENLADLWRASLRRLEELAHQPPEQIVKAGHDLALAAALFADLPDDAGKPLAAIAARIPPSLTYARSELISILDLLPPGAGTPLYEQQATRAAFWAGLQGATIAHLACHGRFGIEDTLESALLLAGDTRLTLRELVTGDTTALAHVRLAVLSACQTAIIDFRRVPDESIGLPGGFLQAGVPAVVGSLWSVNDLSTALLMHRFYELYLKGDTGLGLAPQAPARALRLAQQWLRSLTNEAMFAYFERHRQLKEAQRVPGVERMPLDLIAAGRDRAEEGILLESPAHQPYADPIYWAAFAVHGALEV